MTEDEFIAWYPDGVRAEWVDGGVIMMSPVGTDQDDLNLWFAAIMRCFAEFHELGKVFGPNATVRFAS